MDPKAPQALQVTHATAIPSPAVPADVLYVDVTTEAGTDRYNFDKVSDASNFVISIRLAALVPPRPVLARWKDRTVMYSAISRIDMPGELHDLVRSSLP